jgi:hypothetical protein
MKFDGEAYRDSPEALGLCSGFEGVPAWILRVSHSPTEVPAVFGLSKTVIVVDIGTAHIEVVDLSGTDASVASQKEDSSQIP